MPSIHPSSVVEPGCTLDESVEIGPFCQVKGGVRLGPGVRLMGHNYVWGPGEIRAGTTLYPFATVGLPPQHTRWSETDEVGGFLLGENVIVREQATVHTAWKTERPTTVGDGCFLMVACHIGHDVLLGRNVTVCNNAQVSGHAEVGDNVYISGPSGIHQFVRIGRLAMVSGISACSMDVPPFCILDGRNALGGINLIGMRRAGIDRKDITAVRNAYVRGIRSGAGRNELQAIFDELGETSPAVKEMADFVRASTRGIVPGDGRPRPSTRSYLRRWFKMRDGVDELATVDEDAGL
ncbi:MAG: acyl-ACP--UDP-N-acetylglucosamine O-acyltransferase [Planctomycetota bacterium]